MWLRTNVRADVLRTTDEKGKKQVEADCQRAYRALAFSLMRFNALGYPCLFHSALSREAKPSSSLLILFFTSFQVSAQSLYLTPTIL
jgi:hypothetical protein